MNWDGLSEHHRAELLKDLAQLEEKLAEVKQEIIDLSETDKLPMAEEPQSQVGGA